MPKEPEYLTPEEEAQVDKERYKSLEAQMNLLEPEFDSNTPEFDASFFDALDSEKDQNKDSFRNSLTKS